MSNEIAAPHNHHQHNHHNHHHISTSRHLNNNKITDVPSGKSLVVSLTDDVSFPDQETDLIVQIDKKPDPGDKSNLTVEEGVKKGLQEEDTEGIRSCISCSEKETNGLQYVESNEATQDDGDLPTRPTRDEQEVEAEEMSEVIFTPSHSSGSPSTDESQLLDPTVGSEAGGGGLGTFEEHYGFAPDPSDIDVVDVEFYDNDSNAFNERLAELEEEQEQLNSSLIALTSHFAQVQFRLKQIVDANSDERERLLKELEEFAFRGIPDTRNASFLQKELNSIQNLNTSECNDARPPHKLDLQREKQKELMQKLKNQLEDLEKYAYETGDMNVIPSSMLIERQSVIIEQLKGKLALNLEEMDRLSLEELRKQVDQALKDLINPVIMKEQLVQQLKTQVTDLERFIQYLQSNEGNALSSSGSAKCAKNTGRCTCSCPLHGNSQTAVQAYNEFIAAERLRHAKNNGENSAPDSQEAIKMIKRLMTLLNMITFAQFGCNRTAGSKHFERNILKKTSRAGSHWGDLRAKLEMAIDHLIETNKEISSKFCNDSDYTSDSDDNAFVPVSNEKITSIVRKELATSLRELMEHGLIDYEADSGGSSLIVTHILDWGCFPTRSSQVSADYRKGMTAWDLILKYYEIKEGDHFRAAPARSLSQSFNLHIVGGTTITPRQNLLIAIADVIESHTPFKRRPESHFKAFVSRGLNEGKLATWIRLIVKNRKLVENFYEPWSYTASTGFQDAIKSLDKLSAIKFDLPTDLSVRQLSSITDAF